MSKASAGAITETVDETAAVRKARIRAGMLEAFAQGVRQCVTSPPGTWTIVKVVDRVWRITDGNGGDRGSRYSTKRAAADDLKSGRPQRVWRERLDWYIGDSSDPRSRALAEDERAVVDRVVSELGSIEWVDEGNELRCRIEKDRAGRLQVHAFSEDGYDVWGYDEAGRYLGSRDRAPLQRSPFHTEHDTE